MHQNKGNEIGLNEAMQIIIFIIIHSIRCIHPISYNQFYGQNNVCWLPKKIICFKFYNCTFKVSFKLVLGMVMVRCHINQNHIGTFGVKNERGSN